MVEHENDVLQQVFGLNRKVGPFFSWCDNYDIDCCVQARWLARDPLYVPARWRNSAKVCSCRIDLFQPHYSFPDSGSSPLLTWM